MNVRTDLVFGIVSASPEAATQLQQICEDIEKRIGRTVKGKVLRTFPELVAQVKAGNIDIAWMPPLSAVELEQLGTIKLALGIWRGAGATFSSAIFTPVGSPITGLEQLRGKRMAWVDPMSAAGYVFPRLKLISMGLEPDKTFSDQIFWRTHEDCVRAVMTGRADVGATCVAFYPTSGKIQSAGWSKGNAYTDDEVRILATAGPIPTDAITLATSLGQMMHDRIANALMKTSVAVATRDTVRSLFSGEGFVFMGSSTYDGIRNMLKR